MRSGQYQSLSDMQGFSEASALVHKEGRSQLCRWYLLGNPLQVEWRIRPVNSQAEEGYACWSCRSRETEAKPARETDGSCVVMLKEKVARLVDATGGEDVKRETSVNICNIWVPEQKPPVLSVMYLFIGFTCKSTPQQEGGRYKTKMEAKSRFW